MKRPKKKKNENAKKNQNAKQRRRIFSRTKTHIFKNKDANSRRTMST